MNETAVPRGAVVITGASDGIGAELARVFAAKGHQLALVARRRELLHALAAEIEATGALKPLVIAMDLSEQSADAKLEQALNDAGVSVTILVNNAGYGLFGSSMTLDAADQVGIVDVNVRALTAITLRFLPQLVANKGGLLNVASIAGFMPGPNCSVYYASKAFVLSFTEALAQELRPLGVKVSCLCPGPVLTGFQARAGLEFSGAMAAMKPALVPAADVAREAYEGLMTGKRVVVPGIVNKVLLAFVKVTPHALMLPVLAFAQNGRK